MSRKSYNKLEEYVEYATIRVGRRSTSATQKHHLIRVLLEAWLDNEQLSLGQLLSSMVNAETLPYLDDSELLDLIIDNYT